MKTNTVKFLLLALIAGFVILNGCTATKTAQVHQEEPSWIFHDIVDAEFVKTNISVPMPKDIMLIDSRPYKAKYAAGHIPGAVSMPFSKFDKNLDLLPEEKSTLLIFYCQGMT